MRRYSQLSGTGSYLPKVKKSNEQLATEFGLETSDEWIQQRTGIQYRHVASEEETTSFMGAQAALKAISRAQISPDQIDLIVVATCTPEHAFPSVAGLIQNQIGAGQCPAFDVNAACSGFLYAWSIAEQFIQNGSARCALVVGAETMTSLIDWSDRSTCVLFGDGAGAVILKASDAPGTLSTHLQAQGQHRDSLYVDQSRHICMKGREVYKGAVVGFQQLFLKTMGTLQASERDPVVVDWFVPHQANCRIIESTAEKIGFPMEKVIVTTAQHANTSAASIPLALDLAISDGRIQKGHTVLLEAFGAGWALGSVLFKY